MEQWERFTCCMFATKAASDPLGALWIWDVPSERSERSELRQGQALVPTH